MSSSRASVVLTGPDQDLFAGWCAVWAAAQREDRPDEAPHPMSEHVALARQLLAPGGSREGTHRAAVVEGTVVGALRLVLPLRDNPTVAVLDLAVEPGARRQGIGSSLLAEGVRLARQRGRTELITEVDEAGPGAPGRSFAERHGWTCDLLETRRDLVLPLDESRLRRLEDAARAASTDYELVTWRDRTPDDLLDDRALLERRMTTDAPFGGLPVEEEDWDAARIREYERVHLDRGRTVLSAGAVRDGRLVAFTDLHVQQATPERAHQAGTLVLREHRGHRLGSLVKAAVLRQVVSEFPQVRTVTTYNADSNIPMVAVNDALGFVPAGSLSSWSVHV